MGGKGREEGYKIFMNRKEQHPILKAAAVLWKSSCWSSLEANQLCVSGRDSDKPVNNFPSECVWQVDIFTYDHMSLLPRALEMPSYFLSSCSRAKWPFPEPGAQTAFYLFKVLC